MRRLATLACIALSVCAVLLTPVSAQSQTAASAQQADQSLLAATGKADATAAGALLDADFEWTTPVGISHKRSETLANLSALTADVHGETGVQSYSYDHLVVLTGTRPTSRFMRIWVQRPQGWRLFLMIDTAIVTGTTPPFSVPTSDQAPDCDNPCRNIPFNPGTPAQTEMLATFKRLKMDEWHPNPDDWAPFVLDDVYYVTSAAALSKADRVNRLAQQKQTGAASVPGDPVQFMRIVEFGQSAVMLARHAPFRGGKPYYSVRVWAFRDGKWRFANSQQTTVESAAPIPAVQSPPVPNSSGEQAALQADSNWVAAIRKLDEKAMAAFLDDQFEWTDDGGNVRTKFQMMGSAMWDVAVHYSNVQTPPEYMHLDFVMLSEQTSEDLQPEEDLKTFSYGQLEVITGFAKYKNILRYNDSRFMRVWVKRPEGWRIIAFIQTRDPYSVVPKNGVASVSPSAEASPYSPNCDNPCRAIAYTSSSTEAREIVTIFERLAMDEWHPNADDWARYIVDGTDFVTGKEILSKEARIARLTHNSGTTILPGDPVISISIEVVDDAAVMFALQQPYLGGKPYRSVRVWAFRDGRWQLAKSQQTTISGFQRLPTRY